MSLNFPGGCLAPKLELWGYTQTSGYEVESCNLVSEISHRRTSLLLLTIFRIHLLLMNFNLISVFIVLFCFSGLNFVVTVLLRWKLCSFLFPSSSFLIKIQKVLLPRSWILHFFVSSRSFSRRWKFEERSCSTGGNDLQAATRFDWMVQSLWRGQPRLAPTSIN